MARALFQEPCAGGRVRCRLCPHGCLLGEGQTGRCGMRRVQGGELVSLAWGRLAALHVDPIEKKPFFHVLPGTRTTSFATHGCNLICAWCQNASLSQDPRGAGEQRIGPERIVQSALESGSLSVAATYSEPTVFFELAQAVSGGARAAGLLNLWVTNGFIGAEALEDLAGWLDAANIDLKSFREETYRKWCGGSLSPVLSSIEPLLGAGVWVEVTTLLIPGLNDSRAELVEAARFLARLGPEIPWHLTAFHPDHRLLDRPATSLETLEAGLQIGREAGLAHVYAGNSVVPGGTRTRCAGCGEVLLRRAGYRLTENRLQEGLCSRCGRRLAGRF